MLGFDLIEAKMAWRNLLANKRRSLLTLVVIAIGVMCLLFLSGYINYIKIGFGSILRQTQYGDFQVYPKGFRAQQDESSNELLFSQEEVTAIEDALYDALDAEISFISVRLHFNGQISNGSQTAIFTGYGGDVYGETQMKNVQITEGSLLLSSKSNAIVLGTGLAKKLEATLGTQLILQVPQPSGYPVAELGEVVGIADFGITELNNRYVITDLRLAQALNEGAGAQRLLVHFDSSGSSRSWETLYQEAVTALKATDVPEIELASWKELADYYQKVITLYTNQTVVFSAIFLLMFFFSISNSLYMSIMERQSEIGTLRAIGISRQEIVRVIFLEGMALGILAFILGLIFSFGVQIGLNYIEVYQPPPPGLNESTRLMSEIPGGAIALYGLLTLLIASFATLPPSFKAVRKNIVDAIRTI